MGFFAFFPSQYTLIANFFSFEFLYNVIQITSNQNNFSFKAGLTSQMKREIAACDVNKITAYFSKYKITSDFQNNKTAAWCVLKCFEVLKILNQKYKVNLGWPNGIFVEDLNKLNIDKTGVLGFTNLAPVKLYKNKDLIVPEKTIFFDKLDWSKIDEIADENYSFGINTTDFFLEPFLHEFTHVLHENNLLNNKSGNDVKKFLLNMLNPEFIKSFQSKYSDFVCTICNYARENPLETVACDISKRILNCIDKNTLSPQYNFIEGSPYRKLSIPEKMILQSRSKNKLYVLLNSIWQGKLN